MQNNSSFQDAVARAKQIAQKLAASAPNAGSLKRPNSEDDSSNKRPALTSPTETGDIPASVLRAQQVAQKINSQLGVTSPNDSSSPISNQSGFQEDYKIPDKFVGLIIGKGGEQIVRLQAESGCKVTICQTKPEPVPGGPNPPDRLANLCGSREAIERAKRLMDEIIIKGRMAEGGPISLNPYSMGGNNNKSIDVLLPSAKCGLVIGKGGENIRRVSEEFGVKMYVVQDSADVDGVEHKPLRIMGESDRVDRAKQYVIDSLAKSGHIPNPANRPGTTTPSASFNQYGSNAGNAPITGPCNEATYHVPYEKAGLIIGKGGESIKEINRKSGAFVELDKSYVPPVQNSSERVFKLRGTPDQIVTAQQLMYDKVANGPGGPGEILTPVQFQQKYNLPSGGANQMDSWNNTADQYGNGANSTDPYSHWASTYGQWPQLNSFTDTSKSNPNSAAGATDPSAMGQMDPAWLAYYQQMSYYSMMQANMTGATSPSTATTKATDPTDTSSTTAATNPTAGQADYSQQWIEYYRSVGQNELADQISKQMKEAGPTSSSSTNQWAAYAQQWAANASASNTTNGNNSSTASTS